MSTGSQSYQHRSDDERQENQQEQRTQQHRSLQQNRLSGGRTRVQSMPLDAGRSGHDVSGIPCATPSIPRLPATKEQRIKELWSRLEETANLGKSQTEPAHEGHEQPKRPIAPKRISMDIRRESSGLEKATENRSKSQTETADETHKQPEQATAPRRISLVEMSGLHHTREIYNNLQASFTHLLVLLRRLWAWITWLDELPISVWGILSNRGEPIVEFWNTQLDGPWRTYIAMIGTTLSMFGVPFSFLTMVLLKRTGLFVVLVWFLAPPLVEHIHYYNGKSPVWTTSQLQEYCGIEPFSLDGDILEQVNTLSQAMYHPVYNEMSQDGVTGTGFQTGLLDRLYQLHAPARLMGDMIRAVRSNPQYNQQVKYSEDGVFDKLRDHWIFGGLFKPAVGLLSDIHLSLLTSPLKEYNEAANELNRNSRSLENDISIAQDDLKYQLKDVRRYLARQEKLDKSDPTYSNTEYTRKRLEALDLGLGKAKDRLNRIREGIQDQISFLEDVIVKVEKDDGSGAQYLASVTPEKMRSFIVEKL